MARVLFKYGNYAAYAGATHDSNSIYFIEDTQQIFKGDTLFADVTSNFVKFMSSVPSSEDAKEGVLYIVTTAEGVGIYAKSGDTVEQIGGGKVQPGAIADIGAFDDSVLVKSTETIVAGDNTKIPTAGAVKAAIEDAIKNYEGAFVDVTTEAAPEGETGTVIKFTAKDGSTKSVTIADIFLASASYDSATHILKLTLNDAASSIVEVDLSTLVGNSLSDVVVGEDEAFTVELGIGGSLGGFKTGDTISKDMTAENIIKKLLMKQVAPTYTQPTVAIANNSGTAAGNIEIGTTITPKLKTTFTQNDAGQLTSIQFRKGSTDVGDTSAVSPATVEDTPFVLASPTTYTAVASYGEGAIKKDNLGEDYPTGHIAAGTKTTSGYTFTPYRQGYFAGYTTNIDTLNSDTVRALSYKKNGAYGAGTFNLTVKAGAQRVVIACPATNKGMTKVLNTSALNADVTSTFAKSTLEVEGANGYTPITYNVWTFVPDVAYSQDAILAVTLG